MLDKYKFSLILLIIIIILFIFCKKNVVKECLTNTNNNIDIIPNDNNPFKIDNNKCSKSCCKHIQWKIPDELNTIDGDSSNFIPSNFSCNFGTNSGCLCLTQNQYEYLGNRGVISN